MTKWIAACALLLVACGSDGDLAAEVAPLPSSTTTTTEPPGPTAQDIAEAFDAQCNDLDAMQKRAADMGTGADTFDPDNRFHAMTFDIIMDREWHPVDFDESSFSVAIKQDHHCADGFTQMADAVGASTAVVSRIETTKPLDGVQQAQTGDWALTWSFDGDTLTITGEEL